MEENGTIDADKKVIRIAKDAENPLVQVLGHEVAHGVRRMDGGKFKALQKDSPTHLRPPRRPCAPPQSAVFALACQPCVSSPPCRQSRDSITKCKIFVLNSHHIFDARDLMADWGWGFTNPQPLPNPILSRAKGNFQLAIQKKETEVSLRLTNFVLHMYKQLTSEQRSQIFVLLQKKIKRKEIALLVGCSQSTLSREIRRNSTDKGNYLWDKAHAKAMDRRKRTTANHAKDPAIVWEALDLLKEDYWSPEQISADMKSRGKNISH